MRNKDNTWNGLTDSGLGNGLLEKVILQVVCEIRVLVPYRVQFLKCLLQCWPKVSQPSGKMDSYYQSKVFVCVSNNCADAVDGLLRSVGLVVIIS